MNVRIVLDQNRLTPRCRRLRGYVDELVARCLAEDRRRFAHVAEIELARVDGLDDRRACWKLRPLHGDAARSHSFLEQASPLDQHEYAVLLVADAQLLRLGWRGIANRPVTAHERN